MKNRIIFSLLLGLTAILLFGLVIFFIALHDLPHVPDDLRTLVYARPTEVYATDDSLVYRLGGRSYVSLDQISPHFLHAVVATEDGNFYHHHGIDKLALLRGAYLSLTGHTLQSGSTITQQLTKYLFFSFEKLFFRKVKEILISLQLETAFSKDDILEAYCNLIYFGGAAHGVKDAARQYFAKPAANLTLAESALLAGIINSPHGLNPFSHFSKAKSRQKLVLSRMVRRGFITQQESEQVFEDPLVLSTERSRGNDFIEYVLAEAQNRYGREAVQFGGLRIYTTLDPALQEIAEQELEQGILQLETELDSIGVPLQGALASISVPTGEVRALVGGRRYVPGGFNRAVSENRHVASSIKPFVYLAAIEQLDMTPITVVHDTASVFRDANGRLYRPRNFDRRHRGDLILKAALMQSVNVISAQLTSRLTPHQVVETLRRFGISAPVEEVLAIALGSAGISPLEMASAYAVIANNGVYHKPVFIKRVEDINGVVLDREFGFGEPRFDARACYEVLDMMRGVIDAGTGRIVRSLGFTAPAAGKTGTSSESTDAWFTGFTTALSTSVWVGYDRDYRMRTRSGRGVDGARGAAPIWASYMKRATELYPAREFTMPEGLKQLVVDPKTGWQVVEPQEGIPVTIPEEIHPSIAPQDIWQDLPSPSDTVRPRFQN